MSQLTRLRLENFKPFGPMQEVPLAPITLIYGPNSEGKSSILEAILVLAQTLQTVDPHTVLATRGPMIDVGGYVAVIHQHDPARPLKLGLFAKVDGAELTNQPPSHTVFDTEPECGLLWHFHYDGDRARIGHAATDIFLADATEPLFRLAVNQPHYAYPLLPYEEREGE